MVRVNYISHLSPAFLPIHPRGHAPGAGGPPPSEGGGEPGLAGGSGGFLSKH